MQLTVKTLKGGKFVVNSEPSNTVAEVKVIIETQKPELPAANMKLIHSGKVLKDDATIESCNIKPNAFLVVMISKAKKTAAPAPAPVVAPPAASQTPSTAAVTTNATATATPAPTTTTTETTTDTTPPAANTTTTTTTTSSSTSQPAPTNTTTSTTTTTTTSSTPPDSFPTEMVANLTAMGFPEAEVRACLRASQGNPDVAVEYLMSGIPPYAQEIANASNSAPASTGANANASSSAPTSSSSEPLAALRNHPQINQLRQLVQSNPGTLQAVLTQIGQQQPDLLQEINSNQELFLQIMNEPVGTSAPSNTTTGSTTTNTTTTSSPAAPPSLPSNTGGANPATAAMLEGMNNPAQMAQMIQSMTPEQLQGLAGMMGLSPEQLTATAQLISRMPQEDFQQYLNMAMQGGAGAGGAGLADLMGGLGAGAGMGGEGGAPPGAQVVRLTREEMEAVDRLADMGFDRTEAAQAYLACDKNEALAANLLMDGGWGDVSMGGGGPPGESGGNNGNNDGDDMYE